MPPKTKTTEAERQARREADRAKAAAAVEALTTSEGWQAWLGLRRHSGDPQFAAVGAGPTDGRVGQQPQSADPDHQGGAADQPYHHRDPPRCACHSSMVSRAPGRPPRPACSLVVGAASYRATLRTWSYASFATLWPSPRS